MNPQNTTIFQTWGWLGTLVATIAFLVATALICRIIIMLVRRFLFKAGDGRVGGTIFINIARVIIWLVGIASMLQVCFDFDATVVWGALGVGGVALSLGAQTTISNLLGGLQISFSKDVSIGDWVTIGSISGEVKDITWRKMIVADDSGNIHHIPNSTLISSMVTRLPDANSIPIALVLRSSCDIDAIATELPDFVGEVVREAGVQFGDRRPLFTVDGTELAGISCRLIIYADRNYGSAYVKDVVMAPLLAWLRERGALASST